ncbi:chemotaxis protein CheB [Oceanobacter mangrovi]|uniref:chemotaxis protein CheB n=1 Tax=Oceanobacter mangrovi TaxID=2862510 RepID=UPI001C8D6E60|nr:chemotaxis protein CheB [Oceanobacter mangrovi]
MKPKVGIIADDRLQQHVLRTTMEHFGFEVVLSVSPEMMELRLSGGAIVLDVWLVDINSDDEEDLPDWLHTLLGGDIPVFVGIEPAPQQGCTTYPRWQKRLYQKLQELIKQPLPVSESVAGLRQLESRPSGEPCRIPLPKTLAELDARGIAEEVWVLGASLGGPGAVKEFLDALPAGLPVGFVYAQHIDPRFEQTLTQTVGRHSVLQLVNYQPGIRIANGEVLVAPISEEFQFGPTHETISCQRDWPGPYGPSIDQVILNVFAHYPEHMGIILFSGMGNDGADAISSLSSHTVPVWVQTPASCASASMPESAMETSRVSFHGSPFQLANQLVNRLKQNRLRKDT